MSPPDRPKLRWPIELKMESIDSQEVLLIRCPLGVSPAPLLLVPQIAPIVSCLDGRQSIDDIHERFSRYGVTRELIVELVNLLDSHLFLEGDRFSEADRRIREDFRNLSARPAFMAGLGYGGSPEELRREVEDYMRGAREAAAAPSAELLCLKAPHIDYRRGSLCYGETYAKLRGAAHNLYVLIGTSHQYSTGIFHLTRKHFDGPLGRLSTDVELVDELAGLYGAERAFADEFLHRREHSLELQTPFLSAIRPEARILPILVGSFHKYLSGQRLPSDFEEYESFAGALTEVLARRLRDGARICFVAGVDMAHVGRAFGDPGAITDERMSAIAQQDESYLRFIVNRDRRGLFGHIASDMDARRICGFPTMYTVLDVMDRLGLESTGDVFDYRQAVDKAADCAVTFAGAGLYRAAVETRK